MSQAYTGPGWPNYTGWVENTWGSGEEGGAICGPWMSAATNLVFGTNPPYYLDDFLAFSPKFFGPATALANVATTLGSSNITVPSVDGLMYGQFVQCATLPPGSVITGVVDASTITISTQATSTVAGLTLNVYIAPVVPIMVVQMYINLATASLVQARWQDAWPLGMAWFIAHYCTLWAETDSTALTAAWQTVVHGEVPVATSTSGVYTLSAAPPGDVLQALTNNGLFLTPGVDYTLTSNVVTLTAPTSGDHLYATWPVQSQTQVPVPATAAQIAAQGVATGIMVSKSVGDVSASYAAVQGIEAWAQWNLTKYGIQFASMARVMGAGPMCIY